MNDILSHHGISDGVTISYKIENQIPCKSLKGLNSSIRAEIRVKEYLSVTDPSNYDCRYRQLRRPLFPKYEAYVGDRVMRIIFDVNPCSKTIILLDILSRKRIMNRSLHD
ncbi:MAG TPA: hypothetical protein VN704_11505 [Verrucomicrobiae bacterium]|nr:hypothetical protein [Verrucomicrobiae bacterium]